MISDSPNQLSQVQQNNLIKSEIKTVQKTVMATSKTLENKGENMFKQLKNEKQKATSSYEKVISGLENIIKQLMAKNSFLIKDREALLQQNHTLRKKVESLNDIIEVKMRLACSMETQTQQLFQIIVQSRSQTGETSRQQINQSLPVVNPNLLDESSHILNRNEFVICSNPLSYNISQNEENQISMSNIGRTYTANVTVNQQTPGLRHQNIFIQCANVAQGVVRAFYLSIIQRRGLTRILMKIIQQMRNDQTTIIFDAYPTNEFWVDMLCNFLKAIHQGYYDTQTDVLEYIKCHRLIDILILKCLKNRIEFCYYDDQRQARIPNEDEILIALTNLFGLRLQKNEEHEYLFYTKQIRDENLLLSDRLSLQISLNNKSQNKYYVREQEACFTIYKRDGFLQFSFCILIENDIALSQCHIQEINQVKEQSNNFNYSEESQSSIDYRDHVIQFGQAGGDHLEGIASILNQKDINRFEAKQKKVMKRTNRYQQVNTEVLIFQQHMNNTEPLNSSRFFLNRVGSKSSNFDEPLY